MSISRLLVFMAVVAVIVYALVVGVLLLIVRRRRSDPDDDPRSPVREATAERRIKLALAVTVPVMFVLLVYDFAVGRGIGAMPTAPMLTVDVTGHQWWWQVEYEDPVAQNRVRTANEIHIPVGRPVRVKLNSHDVIHSFWIPNLAGKKDLIPGHHNELVIRADRPGVYRGQCAEFCGAQHAKMAILVVAESPDQYDAWLARQRQPAPVPSDTLALRGRAVLEGGSCAMCHTVASTRAGGGVGPDLTHVASRRTLGAGALPNTVGNLAGWVVDPHSIKPGVHMPANSLEPADLRALLAYLRTLR